MPEFKKKTALGLRDVPEKEYHQECTHVLLTRSEYDDLLAKMASMESQVGTACAEANQRAEQAEKAAQIAANQVRDAARAAVEEANRKIDYLDNLNKNLLRIAKERANADRKLRPKKTHTGYQVLMSRGTDYRYKGIRGEAKTVELWKTVLQSPYSVEFTEEQARNLIGEFLQLKEDTLASIYRIGIEEIYNGNYEQLLYDKQRERRKIENRNIMLKPTLCANYKTGYWEMIFLHTKPLGLVPADMRRQ